VSDHRKGGGWIAFAGVLLMLSGVNTFINGLWALNANDRITSSFKDTLLFSDTNLDTWGWIYVVIGAIVVVAGLCVFWRIQWARWVGVIAASVSMVMAFFWLFNPNFWVPALVTILIDALVLHGLLAYGGREEVTV
jgi:hypothetical protein